MNYYLNKLQNDIILSKKLCIPLLAIDGISHAYDIHQSSQNARTIIEQNTNSVLAVIENMKASGTIIKNGSVADYVFRKSKLPESMEIFVKGIVRLYETRWNECCEYIASLDNAVKNEWPDSQRFELVRKQIADDISAVIDRIEDWD